METESSFEVAIGDFVADLRLLGRRPLTIEAHQEELQRLGRWLLEQGISWHQVTRRQLQEYARKMTDLAHSTRANKFTTWRVFFRWAVEQGEMSMSPAAHFKTPRRARPVPKSLNSDQVRRLIKHLDEQAGVGLRQQRDRALLFTALYAGLRAAELAAICWPAIDINAGVITVRLSKMNHGRSVPLHPQLADLLTSWRTLQAGADDWPVFSLDGESLSPARPGKIARRAARESGVPFSTHILRHTFATWMLRKSGNLYAVSRALGHLDLKQTEVYLSATIDDLRSAVDSLPDITAW